MATLAAMAAILGRLNPAIYDFIFPHGPVLQTAGARRISVFRDEVAAELNPQPLPPKELQFFAAAQVAHEIAAAAVAAQASGGNPGRLIDSVLDEWCGNGRWPWPWPGPGPDPRGPFPDPWDPDGPVWDIAGMRLVGALTFAGFASRMQDGAARKALAEGADRLLDVAVGNGVQAHKLAATEVDRVAMRAGAGVAGK